MSLNMDNSEHSHLVYFSKNVNTGNAGSRNPGAANANSEQAVEDSTTGLLAFDVEDGNTTAVSSANLEVRMEVDTEVEADKAVQCATVEYPHMYLPAFVKNEPLGNAVGTDSSGDATISCEIVGDMKVCVSPAFSQLLTVQGAEKPKVDPELCSHHSSTFAAASAVDDVEELRSSFNMNAELKDGESENVLSCDSGGGMTSSATAAADAGTVETEFVLSLTDGVPQSQDTFGTDIDDLPVMRSDAQISIMQEGDSVVILYDIEDRNDYPTKVPDPYPCSLNKYKSHMWDRDYVRMPYAADNWQKIVMVLKELTDPVQSWKVVEDAIKQYHEYPEAIDFGGLEDYFCEKDADDGLLSGTCLLDLIPKIAKLAVDLPDVCTRPIRLLRQQKNFMVAMSQYQAACLLANAFFCTYPPTASCELADLNFMGLFRRWSNDRSGSQHAKLDCIFNYFRRVTTNVPTGIITFRRQVLDDRQKWKESSVRLTKKLRVSCCGRIEKDAPDMLHVDFANKYVGGGMLGRGCVQEEILFMLCPELIVSRLLTEVLDDNETLVITGHQRFNNYVGYRSTFRWNGDYDDGTNRDAWGRRTTQLVAVDAQVLWNTSVFDQLSSGCLERELNKAFCGFRCDASEQRCTVATGNWGCGAFGGDPGVKFLVQLMAASLAERPIFYFTFDDFKLARLIYEAHKAAVEAEWTVGDLWQYMQDMADRYQQSLSSELLLQGIIVQEVSSL